MEQGTRCKKCGGKGYKVIIDEQRKKRIVDCECEGVMHKAQQNLPKVELTDEVISEYIPSQFYLDNKFDSKELDRSLNVPMEFKDLRYQTYLSLLDGLTSLFEQGTIPKKSYLLMSPLGYGKKVFAYSSIQLLLQAGKKPSKLLSTHELYMYLDKRDYTNFYREINGKDIVFLTVGAKPITPDIQVLTTVIDSCARSGTSLIVLTQHDVTYLAKMDVTLPSIIGVDGSKNFDYGRLVSLGINNEYMQKHYQYLNNIYGRKYNKPTQATDTTPVQGAPVEYSVRNNL